MAVNVESATTTATRPLAAALVKEERSPRPRGRLEVGQLGLYAALFGLSVLFMIPFAWLLLTSLKPPTEIFDGSWLPSEVYEKNYVDVFKQASVGRWLFNSFIVASLGVVAVLFSSSLVAYGFARLRFRGRKQLFALVMATYLLPAMVTFIPTFLIWNELGLVNTLVPLWAGNLFGSAFYIFMLRQFLFTIPQDLVDAARVDGAGYFRIYWSIMLPLIKPALAAVAVFEFQAKWNDFFTPLIYINRRELYTMALGLATMKANVENPEWGMWMAASVVMTIPMVLLFFFAQRFFIEGVTQSGLKG
jgi:ABC-type glycerol-3-phosphate transport system permease component